MQKNVLDNFLCGVPVSPRATAYQKGCSLRNNALVHCGKRTIVKLDIKDFFGSIHCGLINDALVDSESFDDDIITLVLNLCFRHGSLPMGAPSSPCLSNIAMNKFDREMGLFCDTNNICYTRYSDDMTFSFDSFDVSRIIRVTQNFLNLYAGGMRLNREKTKVVTNNSQQRVTGIVVNEKPTVCADTRRKINQQVYYIEKYGVLNHLSYLDKRCKVSAQKAKRYLDILQGQIAYCLQINPDDSQQQYNLQAVSREIKKLKKRVEGEC